MVEPEQDQLEHIPISELTVEITGTYIANTPWRRRSNRSMVTTGGSKLVNEFMPSQIEGRVDLGQLNQVRYVLLKEAGAAG